MAATDVPTIDIERTLGELVAERPARARVLERAGLDYCCHGQRPLRAAAVDAGLDPDAVAAALAAVTDTHHAHLHEELPLLDALAAKVRDVHGGRHPDLVDVARLVREIRLDLEPHLAQEETVLFPAIREATTGRSDFPSASIADPVRVLMAEHDQAGDLLMALRQAAQDYVVPDDGCASYNSLYERLAHLEADTHLENNVLFPAAMGEG